MNKKKLLGAVVALLVAVASGLGAGVSVSGGKVNAESECGETAGRVRALEVRDGELDKRLDRIEGKLDRLIERGR